MIHQAKTGEGQSIDMALFDCQVAGLANQATNYLAGGMTPGRLGNAHPNIVPYQVFATADGHLILATSNDNQFRRFARVADIAHLADDPRYATNAERVAHRGADRAPQTRVPGAHHGRVDRGAGGRERALRPDQPHRRGVFRSAGHRAAVNRGHGPCDGTDAARRKSAAPLRHAAGIPQRTAAARRAHR